MRPLSAKEVLVEVPTVVKGPALLVARRMVYEVAPEDAVQETLIVVWPVAVAVTPVGAAGGVQVVATGVTEVQVEGAPAAASLPEGWPATW